jgi:sugar (pentulose or hexulose) kinase
MCATFAETEVISLLASGHEKTDIAASVHRAVAARTLGLVAQVGKRTPVVMTGGVANNPAAVHYLSKALNLPVQVPANPQISGAYGAALLALDAYQDAQAAADAKRQDEVVGAPAPPAEPRDCNTCGTEDEAPQLLQLTSLIGR